MQFWRLGAFLLPLLIWWSFVYPQATPLPVSEPPFIFRHLDNSHGLLSNDVFSIAQDHKGYMWIGTGKGLQRYDGLRFVHFPDSTPGDRQRPVISSLHPDPAHERLLFNQLYSDMREWQFLRNKASGLLAAHELDGKKARSFTDQTGRWLVQLYLTDKTSAYGNVTQGIAIVQSPDGTAPRFSYFHRNESLQQLWITDSASGLLLFDERRLLHCTAATNFDGNALLQLIHINPAIVRNTMMDSGGNIWLITWSQLFYRYAATTNDLHRYSLASIKQRQGTTYPLEGWVSSLLEDNHGKVWIGTAGAGLLSYDAARDDFNYILHVPFNDLSIRYNYQISSIFQDREDNIWIGTDRGINIFNPYRQYFTSLGNPSPGGKAIPGSEIDDVLPWHDGKLLVATWGSGVFICDDQLRVERSIFFPDNRDKNLTWCLLDDDDGSTWVGSQHGFLHVLNREGVVVKTLHDPVFEHSTIRCMSKDRSGNIFFGLHNGKIVSWDRANKRFLGFAACPGFDPTTLSSVLSISILKNGDCIAGTINGLAVFDINNRCFKAVYKPISNRSIACNSFEVFNDSLLLAGFENEGLYFFNRYSKVFTKVAFDYNPLMWSVNAIRKDDDGSIWFTTENEVCRFDAIRGVFRSFHPEKGLLSSSFQMGKLVKLPSGKWLTWTHTEVVTFSPAAIKGIVSHSSKPVITGLKVFDKPVFIDSLIFLHLPLRLSYKENFVSIDYSNLQFSGVADAAFYFRLKSVDKDWVSAGDKGSAGYTNLSPGLYRFEVRTGETTVESNIAWIDIEIMAPFWQTWWFKLLCLVLMGGLVFMLIAWRFRHLHNQAALKERIAKTEMMALRAQMNPHFIFNCINGIDALILSDDKYQATMYLNKFALLIRNILDSSKDNTISLSKDLENLRLYIELEQWRQENRFSAEIITAASILDGDYKVPPLVVQPYVENAILHGLRNRTDNNGKLRIEIFKDADRLIYIVEDNGVGRQASREDKQYRSYGMEINLGRLKLFNKQEDTPVVVTDLMVDGQATGTRVVVSLKIV